MRLAKAGVAFVLSLMAGTSASAQDGEGFRSYLREVAVRAREQGVQQSTIDAVLPTLTYNPRVVELDRQQPGSSNTTTVSRFAPYRKRHVDAARINRGRSAYIAQRSKLMSIERQTGVPEEIMIAIWGHETNYGSYTGDFDLPRSLATLAYEGRRRSLFEPEFIATLKMIDRGVPRDRLKGSWAGAFGYPQFLPSIYIRLARDGDGDGVANIWSNEADTLASIANYFVNAGWRPGQPWGFAVRVPTGFDRSILTPRSLSPRCPRVFERHSQWRTLAEWRALGVVPSDGRQLDPTIQATMIEPDGPGETAYLLTGNYRVILDYNCSNYYALSVGLLADAVAR